MMRSGIDKAGLLGSEFEEKLLPVKEKAEVKLKQMECLGCCA